MGVVHSWWIFAILASMAIVLLFTEKTLIDYFLPMPVVKRLRSDKWGCSIVGNRDIPNGMEDTTCKKYCYWDGPIIRGPAGKYFCSE